MLECCLFGFVLLKKLFLEISLKQQSFFSFDKDAATAMTFPMHCLKFVFIKLVSV